MASASEQWHINEPSVIHNEARLRASLPSMAENLEEYGRYQALVQRAVSVFGDEIIASRWLSTPSPDFDGEAPIQFAQKNGYFAGSLEPALIRIEHGIYL